MLRGGGGQTFTLKDFCATILDPSDPPESRAKIVALIRYENHARPKHQFVTLHAHLSMEDMPELDFWIRIDRSPDRNTPHRKASDVSFSVWPADDKVSIGHSTYVSMFTY